MVTRASEEKEKRILQRLLFPPSAVFDGLCSALAVSVPKQNVAASTLSPTSRQRYVHT